MATEHLSHKQNYPGEGGSETFGFFTVLYIFAFTFVCFYIFWMTLDHFSHKQNYAGKGWSVPCGRSNAQPAWHTWRSSNLLQVSPAYPSLNVGENFCQKYRRCVFSMKIWVLQLIYLKIIQRTTGLPISNKHIPTQMLEKTTVKNRRCVFAIKSWALHNCDDYCTWRSSNVLQVNFMIYLHFHSYPSNRW